MSLALKDQADDITRLTLVEAAAALRDGSLSAQAYAAALLTRAHDRRDLNAFITVEAVRVLEAAEKADKQRSSGAELGPLHGVPIAVKDSMSTFDMPTSVGTKALRSFRPQHDAAVVAACRAAGAIIFGKNNLVELSYGLTGVNEHHGNARNPHNVERVTGGSSSGAGAAVSGRLVPAALGGDTVGSIRVPASFCGIVGFRPTTGRWPGRGIAPIAGTLDTAGPMSRSVEDCILLDAVVTGAPIPDLETPSDLSGVRLGYAPRQFLDLLDEEIEAAFWQSVDKLKAAGVVFVEVDLGSDFTSIAEGANWPIFFHETKPHLSQFLASANAPAGFDDIYNAIGSNLKDLWTDFVLPDGKSYFPSAAYQHSIEFLRPTLRRRYREAFDANGIEALVFPTTPLVAPPSNTGDEVIIGGRKVSYLNIAKNTFPSSCAALPGITIPMGASSDGMPIGLELDGPHESDARLLQIAWAVSQALGSSSH